MPSPFHQKYSSQTHKIFTNPNYATPAMPEGPRQETERRASDASETSTMDNTSMASSPPSPKTERRRSSAANRFESFKRPSGPEYADRRASQQDAYAHQGFIGKMWTEFTRGPSMPKAQKEPRDTTTLRQ